MTLHFNTIIHSLLPVLYAESIMTSDETLWQLMAAQIHILIFLFNRTVFLELLQVAEVGNLDSATVNFCALLLTVITVSALWRSYCKTTVACLSRQLLALVLKTENKQEKIHQKHKINKLALVKKNTHKTLN